VEHTNPRPPTRDYARVLSTVAEAITDGNIEVAAEHLEPIAYPPRDVPARSQTTRPLRVSIWRGDSYCCRYCGVRTVPDCVLRCVGLRFAEAFPYHRNWRGGLTHPAIPAIASTVDHVVPGSRGGEWLARKNLVTTCPRCNAIKGDYTLEELGWQLLDVSSPQWDGLTAYFPALWEAVGRPDDLRGWRHLFAREP
jgi:hypothetical protein